ncbi:zinc finger C3HC4 type family protein [Musa troglodytarum]|nr:zinc finger C3HC4 type family protein [Musa troglodytarum]
MQTSRESSDRNGSEASTSSRYRLRFPPLSATLERLGASLARPSHTDNDSSVRGQLRGRYSGRIDEPTTSASSGDGPSVGMVWPDSRDGRSTGSGSSDGDGDGVGSSSGNDAVATEAALSSSSMPASASSAGSMSTDGEFDDTADNLMNMLLQRSEVQDLARWMERVLPFSLLLSMVFIRQHFQDLLGPIWIAAVMVKSNEIVRAQTALEEGRKLYVLAVITLVFIIHVCGVYYWWYRNDDLLHPLVMISPKGTVAFWRALFIIAVNDTMVRQVAMAAKCMVLMRYTSSGGGDHRMQGKMLTVVEHFLLLYRFWLPSPVWFRFFLNEDHGSSLSYLTAGLYLAFKLTLASEKVQLVFAALKALSRNEGDDGRPYATTEQVDESGDLCAICLDRMRAPIALHCDHAFCEDCITRW